jgi:hypothetical protein
VRFFYIWELDIQYLHCVKTREVSFCTILFALSSLNIHFGHLQNLKIHYLLQKYGKSVFVLYFSMSIWTYMLNMITLSWTIPCIRPLDWSFGLKVMNAHIWDYSVKGFLKSLMWIFRKMLKYRFIIFLTTTTHQRENS